MFERHICIHLKTNIPPFKPMKYKNLITVGTSHIAKQSLEEVEHAISHYKPEIIAIELDRKRYYALTHNTKRKLQLSDIKRIGIKGFLFNLFGAWGEEKLGKLVGMKPGAEMIRAIQLAKETKTKLALIDQDIEVTLKNISKELTWKEKWNFIVDIIKGIVFKKSELKKLGIKNLDLTKVPPKTLIKKLIKRVKERYPNLHKVLIADRNEYMAKKIKYLLERHPNNIVAIIGAGHEEDIINIIKEQKITYTLTVG